MPDLIPVDRERCQVEEQAEHSFMTLGPRPAPERCTRKARWILTEKEPNPKDGLRGAMSCCDEHLEVARKSGLLKHADFELIPEVSDGKA